MKPSLFYFGGDFLKKILLFVIPALLFFFSSTLVKAASPDDYSGYPYVMSSEKSDPNKIFYNVCLNSNDDYEVFLYSGGTYTDFFGYFNKVSKSLCFDYDLPFETRYFSSNDGGSYYYDQGKSGSSAYFNSKAFNILHCDFPAFQSKASAQNYYLNGIIDDDAYFPEPPVPDFDPASDAHDFSKDVYDPDLSVPVLSNVSYTGFNIENPDSKEWQVVVDGRVYGLKWNPSYTDPMLLTNTNYTVNHQVWNFAEHPDKLSLNGRFDVYDNFGVSTYDWFVAQVRQYANDVHPSDYPNYSFLKVGIKTGWNTFLDYIKDIGSDETENPDGAGHRFEQNIYRSRMCQVTYYVRFVEYDADGSPHYSRWMAYTLKPSQDVLVEGENFSRGNVEFGEVSDVDPVTGRPVVSDKESLKYNTSTGEYEYYDPLSNQNFQFEMNDVFGYISGLKDSVMGFSDLIAYCFSFLPSWVSQFISYSLVVAISFSVIRLIRG